LADTTYCIDWLQVSAEWLNDDPCFDIRRVLPPSSGIEPTGEKGTNVKGYNTCEMLTAGRAHYHTEHRENKISLQFSGGDLKAIDRLGVKIGDILDYAVRHGCQTSRLDYAVDVRDSKGHITDILTLLNGGLGNTAVQTWGSYLGWVKEGNEIITDGTIYIGSKKSDRMMRIYDKGREQGGRADWIRIELVTRHELAQQLSLAMLHYGIGKAGNQAARSFFDCELAWYHNAVSGAYAFMQPIEERDSNTQRWLQHAVIPALERFLRDAPIDQKQEVKAAFRKVLED